MGLYGWWILQDVLRLKDCKRELDALLQEERLAGVSSFSQTNKV
jgi:hypothetical protein